MTAGGGSAFEVRFSEEFQGLTLTALTRVLAVTGGRLIDVKRMVWGQNRGVTVRARPSQSGDMTMTLPATADCTTTAGADYTAASGTLTFADGETVKTVEVAALADAAAEDHETFALTLSNASGATIETAAATGTVTDVAPPLRASLHGLPAEHDGRRLFAFDIQFSQEFQGSS